MKPVSVLFVCLGNICRSPTAHGVFEAMVRDEGLADVITVDSAGTGDWHLGHAPDERAVHTARQRGYDLDHLRARQVCVGDFDHFDYILAMDIANLRNLQRMAPGHFAGKLALFLDYTGRSSLSEVPDPYSGGVEGFEQVLELVEAASRALLLHLENTVARSQNQVG